MFYVQLSSIEWWSEIPVQVVVMPCRWNVCWIKHRLNLRCDLKQRWVFVNDWLLKDIITGGFGFLAKPVWVRGHSSDRPRGKGLYKLEDVCTSKWVFCSGAVNKGHFLGAKKPPKKAVKYCSFVKSVLASFSLLSNNRCAFLGVLRVYHTIKQMF